ncbi:L-lactate dehydrogenase complex protein LldG [Paraburkholderia eburnea]|uniref:L-lactate dehydrogenase complex protein LldG n=1 Tax=Paraburkholderia eburnea TaxID=1189126 RepID=A0A2S4MIT3_9BURK|nr:LUD domain-containing protein [Paraburkholderia eburnea]POR54653.1 L-lactate dehydrogenase complex protein LldG [Paraburkholderia eburnea]PRZ24747.1 L-lactate dehydrogenase complex protein LldG [Paraburkholderia eburnea]
MSVAKLDTLDTIDARARMLGRLRASAPVAATQVEALDQRIDAHYAQRRAHDAATLATQTARIAQFQRMLEAAHADVVCASAQAWPAALAQRLATAGVKRLLLDTKGSEGAALAAALQTHAPAIETRTYAEPIETWKSELFDTIDAGFTVARSGLAATGTLVVVPDANAPRTVSLVPPLHIALIHADTLHTDLHSAVAAERWRDGMPTNLVMISGPSKTSDIQQTTAYGAHGPRALWVVVVTGEYAATTSQATSKGAAQ